MVRFKKFILLTAVLGFLIGLVGSAKADDIAELRKELENQYNALLKVQNKLLELETNQQQQGKTIQTMQTNGNMTIPETLAWIEKVSLYGDFRFRYEYRDRDWSSKGSDDRFRIRARVGLKARINEEFLFDVRFATAQFIENDDGATVGGDYVSGNKTLGDYWASKNLWIDRAYVLYTPNWAEDLKVIAGKTYNPFYKAAGSDLVWDGDINPEGVGIQYGMDLTETDALFVNAFGGIVQENASSSDKRMLGGQVGLTHKGDFGKMTAGVGYYDYSNVEGEAPILNNAFAGNTDDGSGNFLYDYNILELFGDVGFNIGEMPFVIGGSYAMNTASNVQDDSAWLVGCTLNKAKKPGSWEFSYNYRDVGKDAVFGAFCDSDLADGGTNVKGHKFSFGYALAKNTVVAATYMCAENLDEKPDDGYNRLQLDLKVKF